MISLEGSEEDKRKGCGRVIPCVQGKERKEQSGPQEREEYGIAAFHVGLNLYKVTKRNGMGRIFDENMFLYFLYVNTTLIRRGIG